MKIFLNFAIVFSFLSILVGLSGDYETPFPLGTTDLIQDSRINEHLPVDVSTKQWVPRKRAENPARKPDNVASIYSGYVIDLVDLRTCKQCEQKIKKLMDRISELESRLSKLEKEMESGWRR